MEMQITSFKGGLFFICFSTHGKAYTAWHLSITASTVNVSHMLKCSHIANNFPSFSYNTGMLNKHQPLPQC